MILSEFMESLFKAGKRIYWDEMNGNDDNDGLTRQTAKQTWQGVDSILESGDTVVVIGNTFGDILLNNKAVHFVGYNGRIFGKVSIVNDAKAFFEGLEIGNAANIDNVGVILEDIEPNTGIRDVPVWGAIDWSGGYVGIYPNIEQMNAQNYNTYLVADAPFGSNVIYVAGNIDVPPWNTIRKFAFKSIFFPIFNIFDIVSMNYDPANDRTEVHISPALDFDAHTNDRIYLNCLRIDTSQITQRHKAGEPVFEVRSNGEPQFTVHTMSAMLPTLVFKSCFINAMAFLDLTEGFFSVGFPSIVFDRCYIWLSPASIPFVLYDFSQMSSSISFLNCCAMFYPFSCLIRTKNIGSGVYTKFSSISKSLFAFLYYQSFLRNEEWLRSFGVDPRKIIIADGPDMFRGVFRENGYIFNYAKGFFFGSEEEIIYDTTPNKHPIGDVPDYCKDPVPLSYAMEILQFYFYEKIEKTEEKIVANIKPAGVLEGDGVTTTFNVDVPQLLSIPNEAIDVWADLVGDGVLRKISVIDVSEDWKTPYIPPIPESLSEPVEFTPMGFQGELFIYDNNLIYEIRLEERAYMRSGTTLEELKNATFLPINYSTSLRFIGGNTVKINDAFYYCIMRDDGVSIGLSFVKIDLMNQTIDTVDDIIVPNVPGGGNFIIGCPIKANGTVISGFAPVLASNAILPFSYDISSNEPTFGPLIVPSGNYYWIPVMINADSLWCIRLTNMNDMSTAVFGRLNLSTTEFEPQLNGVYFITKVKDLYLACGIGMPNLSLMIRRSKDGHTWSPFWDLQQLPSHEIGLYIIGNDNGYVFLNQSNGFFGYKYTPEILSPPESIPDEVKFDRNKMQFIFEAPPAANSKIYYSPSMLVGKRRIKKP